MPPCFSVQWILSLGVVLRLPYRVPEVLPGASVHQ